MQRDDAVQVPAERLVSQLPTVLVVDDTPDNLVFMSALLGEHYRVKVASSGARAQSGAGCAGARPGAARHHDAGHGRL